MADYAEILRQLSDPDRFSVKFPSYPPTFMQELNNAWPWDDDETGLPIFENPNNLWRRHLPSSFTSGIGYRPEIRQFVLGMRGDEQQFFVPYSDKRELLGRILLFDIKKVQIQDGKGGINVTKTQADLVDFDQTYPFQPLRVTINSSKNKRKYQDLISEINLNAARGFKGPWTYPCRHPSCTISGQLMTASPVVAWGPQPNQTLALIKRFKCNCNNVTYLLHCGACLRQGQWTSYVGETKKKGEGKGLIRLVYTNINSSSVVLFLSKDSKHNFHDRIHMHVNQISNQKLCKLYGHDKEYTAAISQGIVQFGEENPDCLTRDPYTQFNFVHSPQDRKYTILDGNYLSAGRRRVHEGILIHQLGNCIFNEVSHPGNLNHDF